VTPSPPFRFAAVFWAGLIAGTLDITDALVFYGLRGVRPVLLLQNIASGLLRASAFRGGLATAALGLLLHFVICGLLYGLGVYLFMNLVVLPLTFPNRHPLAGIALVNGVLAVMLCIGLAVSIVVARYSR
jgi:hypothetical protein